MKHYITKALLCLSMALLVFNCQKEEITEEHSIENKVKSGLKIVKLTSKDIEENKGITEKLNFFTETLKTRQQNKTVYSSEHDFYINTDFATYIEKPNGSHTYTFPVQYANETGEINNLVLHSQDDGSYKAIYVSYDVTEDEKALINQGVIINLEGKLSIALINDAAFIDTLFSKVTTFDQCLVPDYSVGPCNAGYTYEHGPEPFSGYSGGMCSGSVYTLINVSYDMDCINAMDNGSPGSGTTSSGDSGGPNGNPNGGGSNTSDNDPTTTPVVCEGCPEVEEECTFDDTFTSQISNLFGEGNYTITCNPKANSMNFGSIVELEEFLEDLQTIDALEVVDTGETDQDGYTITRYKATLRDVALVKVYLEVDAKIKKDDLYTAENEFELVELFSIISYSGPVFNFGWTPAPYVHSEEYPNVVIDGSGFAQFSYAVEGLGVSGISRIDFKAILNKFSGENVSFDVVEY